MKRSFHHRNIHDLMAHYLSPLHLFSPVIRCACRTRRPTVRRILYGLVKRYERIFKAVVR